MKRYLRIFYLFMKYSFMVKMEYRMDFLFNSLVGIGWPLISLISFEVIFKQTSTLAGWTKNEVLILYGVFMIINVLWYTLFFENLNNIPELIRSGKMDYILLLPLSSQFILSLRSIFLSTISNIFISIIILVFSVINSPGTFSLLNYLLGFLLIVNGLVIIYSIMLIVITSSFWFIRFQAFGTVYLTMTEGARYPVTLFKNPFQFIFTYIIPLGIIFTLPAKTIVKNISFPEVAIAFLIGLILFVVSHKIFYIGIRNYNSASG